MQRGEQSGIGREERRVPLDVLAHGRSSDPFEHEVGTPGGDHLGSGEALRAGLAHDRDLMLGDVAPAVPAEDRAVVQRVHVGVPSPSEERTRVGYAFTT